MLKSKKTLENTNNEFFKPSFDPNPIKEESPIDCGVIPQQLL